MARCELTIELDEPSATVPQGEPIAGTVIVRVGEETRCERLAVRCEWYTRGAGNQEKGEASREALYSGAWWPGEHRYRFSIAAPLGPLSSDTGPLSVGWRVVASAELPWSRDPEATAEFRLLPRQDVDLERPYFFGPSYGTLVEAQAPEATVSKTPTGAPDTSGTPLWAWPLLLLLIVILVYALPAMLALASPFIVYAIVRRVLVRRRFGAPELRVVPRVTCPGGEIEATIVIEPRADVQADDVFVELRAEATVTKGSGRGKRTTTTTLHARRESFAAGGRRLRAGERFEASTVLPIPPEGPYTFAGSDNRIVWTVEARAEIPWWPDWMDSRAVEVRPGKALAPGYRRPSGPG